LFSFYADVVVLPPDASPPGFVVIVGAWAGSGVGELGAGVNSWTIAAACFCAWSFEQHNAVFPAGAPSIEMITWAVWASDTLKVLEHPV
jgi:hypothetical protein